jgi:hypothetical protein
VLADELASRQGMSRRQFFRTASGMAAAFVAMNDAYGPQFEVGRAEAATPELAAARADELSGQFVIDGHTHFLRDDTQIQTLVRMREAVGKAGWNPDLIDRSQTIENLKFDNYVKEIEPTAYANLDDGLAKLNRDNLAAGGVRSNLRYGYVTRT